MGISDQFKDKAEQLQQQGKERAQGMKDEAQQRMKQRKDKKQGESERGREDMSMRDRQGAMDEDYDV